jgi:hypothetical protein
MGVELTGQGAFPRGVAVDDAGNILVCVEELPARRS